MLYPDSILLNFLLYHTVLYYTVLEHFADMQRLKVWHVGWARSQQPFAEAPPCVCVCVRVCVCVCAGNSYYDYEVVEMLLPSLWSLLFISVHDGDVEEEGDDVDANDDADARRQGCG